MSIEIRTSTSAVPQDNKNDENDIISKVGNMAKFIDHEENNEDHSSSNGKIQIIYSNKDQQVNIENNLSIEFTKTKQDYQFIGLKTKLRILFKPHPLSQKSISVQEHSNELKFIAYIGAVMGKMYKIFSSIQ